MLQTQIILFRLLHTLYSMPRIKTRFDDSLKATCLFSMADVVQMIIWTFLGFHSSLNERSTKGRIAQSIMLSPDDR